MVGHQAPSQDFEPETGGLFRQKGKVGPSILIVPKDGEGPNAPLRNMVGKPGDNGTGESGHGRDLSFLSSGVSRNQYTVPGIAGIALLGVLLFADGLVDSAAR